MEWPAFYPPDCPPKDANEFSGSFFRFVENDPPNGSDFLPMIIQNPNKKYTPLCKACGISLFKNETDLNILMRRIPAYRNKKIAHGTLNQNCGRGKHTPNQFYQSHYTWWIPDGLTICEHFVIFYSDGE